MLARSRHHRPSDRDQAVRAGVIRSESMDGFEGRGAVITGGASGIGLATATEFARRGARVVLADVDKPTLEQAVKRLRAEGFDAHGVTCDVRHLEEMVHLADEAFRLLGDLPSM